MSGNQERYCVDLFAGCGGLSLGLEISGFKPLLVNELSDEARESYLINRTEYEHLDGSRVDDPEHPFVWKDVKELRRYIKTHLGDFQDVVQKRFSIDIATGDLDLLVGGPPCQGYSGIGHRRSYAVDKKHIPSNHLYEDMIFLISQLQPKVFLFENVKGLLSARWHSGGERGEIWRQIRAEFKSFLGDDYFMGWHLVRAAEYGVPQNRPRILLAGMRRDLGWNPPIDTKDDDGLLLWNEEYRAGGLLPDPEGVPPSLEELLGDLIDPDYKPRVTTATTEYPNNPIKPRKGEVKSIQEVLRTSKDGSLVYQCGDELTEHHYSRHSEQIVRKFKYMIDNGGQIPKEFQTKKFAQRVLPKTWPNGEPTITATSLPDDYVHFDPRHPRILSVREWARLQMFPDWYQFAGKRTTGGLRRAGNPKKGLHDREVPKYTQIGNAVPVSMAEVVGRHFARILDGN